MSNKPPIYAFCPAGCRHETVHKEDFLNASALVKFAANQDGKWYIEESKQYKVMSENDPITGYGCSIKYKYDNNGTETEYDFTIPHDDIYSDSVIFKLLDASVNVGETELTLVYEIAGIRYTETITGTNLALIEENYLYIEDAEDVYLFNDDAGYVFEDKAGLSTYPSSLNNTTSETTSIAVSTITIPSDRAIQVGDFIQCADGNEFKVTVAGTTTLTVSYFQSIKGSQITGSTQLTLAVADWDSTTKTQTISLTVDTNKRNEIDVDSSSLEEWANCGVYASSESSTGITFTCRTIPENALTFRVVSSEVSYAS